MSLTNARVANTWLRQWRATTAVRVFTLALATGGVATSGSFGQGAPLLAALALIAAAASVLEWGAPTAGLRWLPVGEALLVSLLLCSVPEQPAALAYLAVPPIVAGVRCGILTTTNTTFMGFTATVITLLVSVPDAGERLSRAVPWLAIGFGVGLLASWQLRSVRDFEARQAPYAEANQLMSQLHQLAQRGAVGLDSVQLATELQASLRATTGAQQSAVFTSGRGESLNLLCSHGGSVELSDLLDSVDAAGSAPLAHPEVTLLRLRGSERLSGCVLLVRAAGWTAELRQQAQFIADDFVLRLDTAVLFDDVRLLAIAEERNRIAREIHDGVAQEVVALGYIVDEIETMSDEATIRELAASLRSEISRILTELRFSIFDLRHHVSEQRFSGALSEYVREVGHDTDLHVHLRLEESGPMLPDRTKVELLRIAQEAVGNVRRHARAKNLWVTLLTDGSSIRLVIEDDGVGNATPRERHWGLQTMTERAERIGAELSVGPRGDGGTVVLLHTAISTTSERTESRDHHSASRR